MNYISIVITAITMSFVLAVIFKLNPKKNKELAQNEELNKLAQKYPSNIEICKQILKKLDNTDVIIEEDNKAKECLYIVITNKIIIAGTQNNFTRIQTIAHECLHSIQDKRIQISNFMISNICIFYFVTVLLLKIFKLIPNNIEMTLLTIYILLSFLKFVIRSYLENDAMIKAKYLAKEYMEEQNICSKEEVDKLIGGFEQINNMGIKGVNFSLMLEIMVRVIIISIIFIIW